MITKICRHPQEGDLIVRKTEECNYMGVVHQINLDKWGHQRNVYITWSNGTPGDYNSAHGYAGVNIHNLRHEFDVIREGIPIK